MLGFGATLARAWTQAANDASSNAIAQVGSSPALVALARPPAGQG
jgi:hypothetical protein